MRSRPVMSFGWRVSQRFLNGLMLAVYVMLAACVPIDETFDYRYAVLQSGYSPFIAATQNQPSTLDGSRIAPDQTDIINLAASQSSTAITQPDKPHKNDLLTKMEISLRHRSDNFNLAILPAGNNGGTDAFTNHAARYYNAGEQQVICH